MFIQVRLSIHNSLLPPNGTVFETCQLWNFLDIKMSHEINLNLIKLVQIIYFSQSKSEKGGIRTKNLCFQRDRDGKFRSVSDSGIQSVTHENMQLLILFVIPIENIIRSRLNKN